MLKLVSKLEANIFSGILVKKGINFVNKTVFLRLIKDGNFLKFWNKGFFNVKEDPEPTIDRPKVNEIKLDYESMKWQDLQAYAKSKGISINKKTKVDIINELKELEEQQKGE